MDRDYFKVIATYVIALVVIIGGGILLVVPSQVPPEQLLPFLTGTVGIVIGAIFTERATAAATARLTGPATHEESDTESV